MTRANDQIKVICPSLHYALEKRKGPAYTHNMASENILSLLLSENYFTGINSEPLCTGPGTSSSSAFPSSISSSFGCLLDLPQYSDSFLVKFYLESRLVTSLWIGYHSQITVYLAFKLSESVAFRIWLPLLLLLLTIVWISIFYVNLKIYKKAVILVTFAPIDAILTNTELKLVIAN